MISPVAPMTLPFIVTVTVPKVLRPVQFLQIRMSEYVSLVTVSYNFTLCYSQHHLHPQGHSGPQAPQVSAANDFSIGSPSGGAPHSSLWVEPWYDSTKLFHFIYSLHSHYGQPPPQGYSHPQVPAAIPPFSNDFALSGAAQNPHSFHPDHMYASSLWVNMVQTKLSIVFIFASGGQSSYASASGSQDLPYVYAQCSVADILMISFLVITRTLAGYRRLCEYTFNDLLDILMILLLAMNLYQTIMDRFVVGKRRRRMCEYYMFNGLVSWPRMSITSNLGIFLQIPRFLKLHQIIRICQYLFKTELVSRPGVLMVSRLGHT